MMSIRLFINKTIFGLSLLLTIGSIAAAQSIDPNVPTPVRTNSLTGKIAARDLGDARLTDHYYMFRGTPGDLLITVESRNLNGDIDVFTAGTLRPLLKLTLYAESTAPVTKGIYLRRNEDLILRIEARSPNDDEGVYQFHFGGSFQPVEGGPDIAENETPSAPTTEVRTGRKTRRTSSVGARIEEPAPPVTEVATATPTPEPTPEPTPVESPSPKESEKPATAPARSTPRSSRTRRPTTRRTTPAAKPKEAPTEEAKKEEPGETPTEPKPKPPARNTSRRAATERATEPEPEPQPDTGPRLIIETNDGTLINRSMTSVRRVTVENGQVVVIGKDGKIDRIRLANVVRMQIQ